MNHKVATKYIQVISIIFFFAGLYWAVSGMFDPFGIYESAFANQFWQTDILPKDASMVFSLILGPLGATCAGYFLMQFFIATFAYARKEKWGYYSIVIPFSVWFVVDTLMCLYHGAYFNIYLANIPALLAMLPVYFTYNNFAKKIDETGFVSEFLLNQTF